MQSTRAIRIAVAGLGLLSLFAACDGENGTGSIEASGTIEATEIDVAAKVPGIIRAIYVDEGAHVDSGAVLVEIDHADLDWQLLQAQAAVRLAQANLRQALNGPQIEDIDQARAAVEQTEVQRNAARTELRRVEPLAETGTVPTKQLDDVKARVDGAEAALRQARATLAKLEAGTRSEAIDAARARVDQASAQVGLIERKIADCTVRAPLAGTVTDRLMEPGEMANPGSALLTVSQLNPVRLQVYLSEVEVGSIRLGQIVRAYIDAQPDAPFVGTVTYISPVAEFTPKNIQTKEDRVKLVLGVEITLDNPEGLLKPGLPADADFGPEISDATRN